MPVNLPTHQDASLFAATALQLRLPAIRSVQSMTIFRVFISQLLLPLQIYSPSLTAAGRVR